MFVLFNPKLKILISNLIFREYYMQCFITEHLLKYRYYELLKSELDMLKIINFNFKNCIRIGSSLSQNDDNSQPE